MAKTDAWTIEWVSPITDETKAMSLTQLCKKLGVQGDLGAAETWEVQGILDDLGAALGCKVNAYWNGNLLLTGGHDI